VGDEGTRQVTVRPGWNLLTLSEGRERTLADAFAHTTGGNPAGGATPEEADRLIVWDDAGVPHHLMLAQGLGAPYDGNWIDLDTMQVSTLTLKPGRAFYYYRLEEAGTIDIGF
jgi:hypothetical protein